MSSSEKFGPEVGETPDFWIGEAPEDFNYSDDNFVNSQNYEDVEELVYEGLHEAAQNGSTEYSTGELRDLAGNFASVEPSEEVGRPDEVGGMMLVDGKGKALYALTEDHGDTVELDIKIFGDRAGVEKYIKDLPTGGYAEGVDTVDGQAFKNATADAGDHPMDVETETQLSEPGDSPDEAFNNAQTQRIVNEVLEEQFGKGKILE